MSRVAIAVIAATGGAVRVGGGHAVHRRSDRAGADHPVRQSGPGDHAARAATKTPFVQTVIGFDKRLLNLELPGEQVILGDQRRLVVDSFTLFRIIDPLLYYQSVGTAGGRHPRPAQFDRLGVAAPRARQQQAAGRAVGQARADHGDDPRPGERRDEGLRRRDRGRADPPRRPAGREHQGDPVAHAVGAAARGGAGARRGRRGIGQRIRADAERERTVLLAEARATPDKLRGEGEAEATRIYAKAYEQDVGFLLRSGARLQAYRDTFDTGNSRLVLTPDNDFLRYLQIAADAGAGR